jgi:hypothetical protein
MYGRLHLDERSDEATPHAKQQGGEGQDFGQTGATPDFRADGPRKANEYSEWDVTADVSRADGQRRLEENFGRANGPSGLVGDSSGTNGQSDW